jgi:hypothetical protein
MKRLIVAASASAAFSACALMTDAATRLANDIQATALRLNGRPAGTRALVLHQPRSWPAGCKGPYEVTLQANRPSSSSCGSLLVGCVGSENFKALGYDYSTTYHCNFVSVPRELKAQYAAAAPVRIALEACGRGVCAVGIE